MGRINVDQAEKLNERKGGNYFKINQDESKQVRFLWDSASEIAEKWLFGVHSVTSVSPDGSRHYAIVDCPKSGGDPDAICKYCAGEVMNPNNSKIVTVPRVVIPLFNIDEGSIQYWVRSYDWVKKSLLPVLEESSGLPSLANQTFKVKRAGSGLDTSYTVLPVINSNDARTKNDFGEIKDPFDLGIIKRYGEENNQNQGQNQGQGQGQPFGQAPQTGYQRRTTEMF